MAGYQSALSPTTFRDTAGARPRGSRNGGVFTEGSFCDCALQDPNVLPVRLEDAAGARAWATRAGRGRRVPPAAVGGVEAGGRGTVNRSSV